MLVNNNSNNQNKAVAYVRVSSQRQAEEGVSIAAQIKTYQRIRKFQGHQSSQDEDILVERGVSGGIPLWERPNGWQIEANARFTGKYEHVITMKLDRMFQTRQRHVGYSG